jgi:hypothetical protein
VLEQRVLSVFKRRALSVLEQWAGCFVGAEGAVNVGAVVAVDIGAVGSFVFGAEGLSVLEHQRRQCCSSGYFHCWSRGSVAVGCWVLEQPWLASLSLSAVLRRSLDRSVGCWDVGFFSLLVGVYFFTYRITFNVNLNLEKNSTELS